MYNSIVISKIRNRATTGLKSGKKSNFKIKDIKEQ